MELDDQHQETTSDFMPVIPRLDRLDRLLQLLEEKHSMSRIDSSANNFACKSLTTVLEEVHHKGTLMERLSILENRVLQLSLEMDEYTSKSSSSTFQVYSETTSRKDASINIQEQERTSTANRFVAKRTAQDKINGYQKRKSQKKWLGLFRVRLMC